jgi:protein-S-isoprenylcysteine O-methyltransferase Ste14
MINVLQQKERNAMNEKSESMDLAADKEGEEKFVPLRRIGTVLTKILTLFVILEPIWMLLPFAGFLYGSVFHIQVLNQNPYTAWLTHFVFPVLSLGLTGPILIVVGFVLFLVGAAQIYWAKIRRSGLVTRGLYSFVRHPQYISLTLFGLGVLLTWGRAITFIAFFVMMFLYYYLTKSEERTCIRIFGDEYERYRERTSFIIPGDKLLRPLRGMFPGIEVRSPYRVAGAFVITMTICFVSMWSIQSLKLGSQVVPYMTADVPLSDTRSEAKNMETAVSTANGIPVVQAGRPTVEVTRPGGAATARLVLVQAPILRTRIDTAFAKEILDRLIASEKFRFSLSHAGAGGNVVPVAFPTPGPNWSREHHGKPQIKVFVMLARLTGDKNAPLDDLFCDGGRVLSSAFIAPMDFKIDHPADCVGETTAVGPRRDLEERWSLFLSGLGAAGRPHHH